MTPDPPRLTSDLDRWVVTLTAGDVIEIRAHGAKEDGDHLVFVALMEGTPPFEYELLRLPSRTVSEWSSG